MKGSFARVILVTAASLAIIADAAFADVPFPPLSTCTVTVTQFPPRPACFNDWEPDVVRLTPAGSNAVPVFDRVSITVRVRDANNDVVPGALVSFAEQEEARKLNIANGGATTAMTDTDGLATVALHAASGNGRVALCADGVPLCNLQVRSPDVEKCGITILCGIGTAASSVSGCDITHATCGFLVNFGPVTVGDNEGYDLDCSWSVSGPDITGQLGKGGVLQYFGDIGTLGSQNACAP
jgi:hypothetical protein